MIFLTAFSGLLFIIPVFVTFGIYFGIEHERILRCGFSCDSTGNGTIDNPDKLVQTLFCQKSYAISPPPGEYIFNPNQWGDPDNTGQLCINFLKSGLDVAKGYAPSFAATWQYPQGPIETPVHAFANADLNLTNVLPIQLSAMSELTMEVEWSYNVGNDFIIDSDWDALADSNVNANVALDLFLAADDQDALSTTESDYEVMVWLGRLGAYTLPLGYDDGSLETREVNGISFDLYTGANDYGQTVLTWLSDGNTTAFSGNIGPLVQDLDTYAGPSGTDYLGYVAFGTETLYADMNATLYVPTLKLDVLQA